MKNMKIRVPMYFIGLFIMTIGIAISVKSNLGVSQVSSNGCYFCDSLYKYDT